MTVTLTKYLNQTTVAILRHQLKEKKKTMLTIFILGFSLGVILTSLVMLVLMNYEDMKDLENRTGRYAPTTKGEKL
jgi:heme/copper-type cytochrome/quinol oxidase subunit 4